MGGHGKVKPQKANYRSEEPRVLDGKDSSWVFHSLPARTGGMNNYGHSFCPENFFLPPEEGKYSHSAPRFSVNDLIR